MKRFVALALALSSCSFVFVQRAPAGAAPSRHIECPSPTWPIALDTIAMIGLDLSTVLGWLVAASEDHPGTAMQATVVALPIAGTIYGVSTYYGSHERWRCHRLRGELDDDH